MRSLLTYRNARLFVWFLAICVVIIWVVSRKQPDNTKQMQIGSASLRAEISQSQDEILLGLSYRDSLAKDHGMLFVMPYAKQQSFWMKGMRFPLDMVFIEGMRVVEIRANIPAPVEGYDGREISVASTVTADMVLEVNAGWASSNGIQIGNEVSIDR